MKIGIVRQVYDDEEVLDALPAPEDPTRRVEAIETLGGLLEVLLKAPTRLDAFIREPALRNKLAVGFSAIILGGLALYAAVLVGLLFAVPTNAVPGLLVPHWHRSPGSAVALLVAWPVGLWVSTFLCVPGYAYFARMFGARLSLSEVAVQSLKGKAAMTTLLVGVLPVYAVLTFGLAMVPAMPPELLAFVLYLGLFLPFIMGLRGVQAVYAGFRHVVSTLPRAEQRKRYTLPDWLIFLWSGLFVAIGPLFIYKVWDWLGRLLA